GVERRYLGAGVVQGEEVAVRVRWESCGRPWTGAGGAEHAAVSGAEGDAAPPLPVARDGGAVPHAGVELGREPEDADQQPDPAHGDGAALPGPGGGERVQRARARV